MLSGETKLGGKLFAVVNYEAITVINEHYIMKMMRASGLDRVLPAASDAEESDEAYMMRMHSALVDTLQLPALLAGYLLPVGKTEADWTLQMAEETRQHIERLTKPADKAEIHRLGLLVTFNFFAVGLASLNHSRSALETLRAGPTDGETTNPPSNAAH